MEGAPNEPVGVARELAVKLLGALAAGVSLVGLIVVVGGAVMFVQFDAAGIPTSPSLALIAKEELTATGLASLLPFVGIAVLVVLILYVIDPGARVDIDPTAAESAGKGKSARIGKSLLAGYRDSWPRALFLIAAELVLLLILVGWPQPGLLAIAIATAIVGAVISFGVAGYTDSRFGWFAVVAFFSILLFGAVVSVYRTYETPKVQPAAILLSNELAFTGIYVAQTSDRIYLARITPDHELRQTAGEPLAYWPVRCVPETNGNWDGIKGEGGTGRLYSVRRDDVLSLAIGESQGICQALEETNSMADGLKKSNLVSKETEPGVEEAVVPATEVDGP